jgi:type I restriction enzyme M protein
MPFVDSLDYREQPLVVTTSAAKYYYDNEQETLMEESKGQKQALGCGKIVVKTSYKSARKKRGEHFEVTIELTPDTEKDYEIIPFHMDATKNQAGIAAFMAKYVSRPFEYLENVVGVEINFNKIFYSPEQLGNIADILVEIEKINQNLKLLEEGLNL